MAGGGAGADERMRAVVIRAFGGPDVLTVERVPRPAIGLGHTLIKVARAGVNFFDTERRAAGWPAAHLPEILGTEVAGARVSDGRRVVGLTDGGVGGYAEYARVADEFAVPIPDDVPDTAALGVLIQGLTAWHTLRTAAGLRRDESVVITAAAGGLAASRSSWRSGAVPAGSSLSRLRRRSAAPRSRSVPTRRSTAPCRA